jgi:hypothetical protein
MMMVMMIVDAKEKQYQEEEEEKKRLSRMHLNRFDFQGRYYETGLNI